MTVQDIKQLRENAERLNEVEVVELCKQALAAAAPGGRARTARKPGVRTRARRLIARAKAFEARGVFLQDARTSWSGVRKSDGMRPWSDAPAGKERLDHCRQAIAQGAVEGLLVYGERLAGHIPEDRAYTVHGVDPETVISFRVEMRGAEFWATWGKKAASSAANA
jgi:hypothetical protein